MNRQSPRPHTLKPDATRIDLFSGSPLGSDA